MPNTGVRLRRLAVPIADLPRPLAGVRIAHVCDFHFRKWTRCAAAAQQLLLSLDYELLVATGDFADGPKDWRRAAELTERFFAPLAKRGPIYATLGNHDPPALAEEAALPLHFLCNRWIGVEVGGETLVLAGVRQAFGGGEDLVAALRDRLRGAPVILLAHYPSTALRVPPGVVDLMLSGHTHGGQIRLPGIGCVWTNNNLPRAKAGGLHWVNDVLVHISPGIGVAPPVRVRWNCPAEVSLLTLQPAGPPTWKWTDVPGNQRGAEKSAVV